MNNNPIEELRRMETPVSESEWDAIVHDKRYVQKFGRKPGLSPKGRAALIAGAAAVLIAIPILFKTLSNKSSEAAQTRNDRTCTRDDSHCVANRPENYSANIRPSDFQTDR